VAIDWHRAQYCSDNRNIRICVAVPGCREAPHGETMLLELFPLIAAAVAALSFFALTANESFEGLGRQLSNAAPTKSP
jgi:hypothetical protein